MVPPNDENFQIWIKEHFCKNSKEVNNTAFVKQVYDEHEGIREKLLCESGNRTKNPNYHLKTRTFVLIFNQSQ